MRLIYCDVNGFPLNYSVKYFNEETKEDFELGQFTRQELGMTIVDLCMDEKINNVHLFGPEEQANDVAEDIQIALKFKYANNKIEIEVN